MITPLINNRPFTYASAAPEPRHFQLNKPITMQKSRSLKEQNGATSPLNKNKKNGIWEAIKPSAATMSYAMAGMQIGSYLRAPQAQVIGLGAGLLAGYTLGKTPFGKALANNHKINGLLTTLSGIGMTGGVANNRAYAARTTVKLFKVIVGMDLITTGLAQYKTNQYETLGLSKLVALPFIGLEKAGLGTPRLTQTVRALSDIAIPFIAERKATMSSHSQEMMSEVMSLEDDIKDLHRTLRMNGRTPTRLEKMFNNGQLAELNIIKKQLDTGQVTLQKVKDKLSQNSDELEQLENLYKQVTDKVKMLPPTIAQKQRESLEKVYQEELTDLALQLKTYKHKAANTEQSLHSDQLKFSKFLQSSQYRAKMPDLSSQALYTQQRHRKVLSNAMTDFPFDIQVTRRKIEHIEDELNAIIHHMKAAN